MTTAQQQCRTQPRQRRKALPPAEASPVIQQGRAGLRIFREACEAYNADMAAEFDRLNDALSEIRADAARREAAAYDEYDQGRARHAAAYAKRTAASHEPEPDADTEDTAEPAGGEA